MEHAYTSFLAGFGVGASAAEFAGLNGPPLATVVETLVSRHELGLDPGAALARYNAEVDHALRAAGPSPGAEALLTTARVRGWRVAIVTSNTRTRVAGWLERNRLEAFIDVVVDGEEGPGKPDPWPYLEALRRLGADAAASIAVEDSAIGASAAVAAGLRTLFYRPASRPPGPGHLEAVGSMASIERMIGGA